MKNYTLKLTISKINTNIKIMLFKKLGHEFNL
jgi:hypothetical protein